MPLIQIFTSCPPLEPGAQEALLRDLSRTLSDHFEKPETWVMTCLVPNLAMTFAGDPAPACFATVKNVGKLTASRAAALSDDLTGRLAKGLGVARARIYLEFTEAEGRLWGWNGTTFG